MGMLELTGTCSGVNTYLQKAPASGVQTCLKSSNHLL